MLQWLDEVLHVSYWREYRWSPFGQLHVHRARPDVRPGQSEETRHAPVLCLHMTPYSGRVYRELLEQLGIDRSALAPDTPGYGASDPPDHPPSIEDYAACMAALIEDIGEGPVDIVGYHTGSSIAVEVARMRPDLVRSIALISVAAFPPEVLDERRALFGASRAQEVDESGEYLVQRWCSYRDNSMSDYPAAMRALRFPDALLRPDISWWGHQAVYDHPVRERLSGLEVPVLVLNPEDDLEHVTARARSVLGEESQYLHLPGWSHGLLQVRAVELAQLLRSFFDRA